MLDLSKTEACSRFIEDRNLPSVSSGGNLVLQEGSFRPR